MELTIILLLFIAGFLSGIVNAVAGGGTFITFAALTLAGLPPIMANATSAISQFPGYITSTLAYLSDIKKIWRGALILAAVSVIGSLIGALILLALDNPSFRALVPWLLIAATLLFWAGPWLTPKKTDIEGRVSGAKWKGPLVQFCTSIYGGFFGAGMGIMMLATLGLTEGTNYHRLNALKNLLSIVIAAVAVIVFTSGGVIGWVEALILMPAVALGGWAGVWTARRVPLIVVRLFVIITGFALAGYYLVT